MAVSDDPFAGYNFIVEIDGLEIAAFARVSGIGVEITPIEYREGTDKYRTARKLPGLVKYPNIVLSRGLATDGILWSWLRSAIDGPLERRDGAIVLLDDARQPLARYRFRRGWICKYSGPCLDASGNEVAIETIEICHEGIELVV